jgi:hypothetical protein
VLTARIILNIRDAGNQGLHDESHTGHEYDKSPPLAIPLQIISGDHSQDLAAACSQDQVE